MNKKNKSIDRRDFLVGLGAGASLAGAGLLTACTNQTGDHSANPGISDQKKPISPYLIERDTEDQGFSKGWLSHFSPSEELWVDIHTHLRKLTGKDSLNRLLDEWFSKLDAYRLGKIVCITDQEELFGFFDETTKQDPRFAWIYWPKIDAPSLSKVREAVDHGSCAVKMHNAPIIEGRVPRDIYESKEWQDIFSFAETNGIPLLWHVVQRVNCSPYHGGGLHPYWGKGWENGVTFTNEDLLQDMLMLCRRFSKLKIIGAHQLHLGLDRLSALFEEFENLYIDSSCGMFLRWADEFSEETRVYTRNFIEKWSERILFGTDSDLFPGSVDEFAIQGFLCHPRYMLKLWLNDKALQDVAWRNAYQLLKLKSGLSARRGNVRP